MKRLGGPLLVLACMLGIGADAPADSAVEAKVTTMASACLAAKHTTSEEANAALVACQKLLADLAA
ncbi:MAG: hypothetical protein JWM33_987 [Caulobacteraceae bacterium]|nr:hypothetical protein [Caulobacteraceae bacterium]